MNSSVRKKIILDESAEKQEVWRRKKHGETGSVEKQEAWRNRKLGESGSIRKQEMWGSRKHRATGKLVLVPTVAAACLLVITCHQGAFHLQLCNMCTPQKCPPGTARSLVSLTSCLSCLLPLFLPVLSLSACLSLSLRDSPKLLHSPHPPPPINLLH